MTYGSKPPTIDQAVEVILRCRTDSFRHEQIVWWRERFGKEFADIVRKKAWEQLKKGR